MTEPLDNDLELMRAAALINSQKTSDVDVLEIQDAAMKIAHDEYMDAHKQLEVRSNRITDLETKWKMIQGRLGMMSSGITWGTAAAEPVSLDDLLDAILASVTEQKKLEKVFKLINENPLLKSQWDRLVMSIRLVGGDSVD